MKFFVVTVALAVAAQPAPLETVTVYVPAPTVIVCAVEPLLHKYVPVPLAVKVVVPPLHVTNFPVMLTCGVALSVTVELAEAVQPSALVTTTLYVPAPTVIVDVVAPLLHK